MVSLPISVVAVTLVVNVIKLFDLIYVMTARWPRRIQQGDRVQHVPGGLPAGTVRLRRAIAIVMLLLLIPVMIFNVRRFRAEAVQQ